MPLILLGDSWLLEHKAVLDYGGRTLTLLHKGKLCLIKADAPKTPELPVRPVLSYVPLNA